MQIVAENLNYVYGKGSKSLSVKALDNVSLTVESGDFFGIIGKTGSGKSTFVQHINGLIKVQKKSGKLTVGDYDLTDKKCDYKSLRSKIGVIFQYPEYQLFAETVFDDVAFGLKNFQKNLTEEQIEQKVRQAIERVGLKYDRVKGKSPFELSGGQKRRVAIAGVIVSEPEVLVLDEPAAGLDPQGKREFFKLLQSLKNDFVKTIVLVSHDMNLITEYCNRGAIFKDGKVVKVGTPQELFGDEELLVDCGLTLPVISGLVHKLNSVTHFESSLTVDGFVSAFKKAYEGGSK